VSASWPIPGCHGEKWWGYWASVVDLAGTWALGSTSGSRSLLRRRGEDEFGLRLAAKAADREKAARQEWPAFEERLRELGYGPRAIAYAFQTLIGPGTVTEALEVLKTTRSESHPIALSFRSHRDSRRSLGGQRCHDHVRRARRLRDPRQLRHRPASGLRFSPTTRRGQGRSRQWLRRSRRRVRARPRRAHRRRAYDAAASPGGNHASHPDHVGPVPLIDLGGTSARSPRLASGLIDTQRPAHPL
jgi:hypothetical protein